MNRSAKRQHHEQTRKRHKHDSQQHARQLAKQPRSAFPRWLLAAAVAIVLGFVFVMVFARG
jgi:hypothetical protein